MDVNISPLSIKDGQTIRIKSFDGKIIKIEVKFRTVLDIPINFIHPNLEQPRKIFKDINELADSFDLNEDTGKLDSEDPIKLNIETVQEKNTYRLVLVDGERRLRAAKEAKLETLSSILKKPMSKEKCFEKSFLANMSRQQMNAIEEAVGMKRLMKTRGWNQSELAKRIGKSFSYVTNILRLLNLREDIQALVLQEKLGSGIALKLASYTHEQQFLLLDYIREKVQENNNRPIHPNDATRIIREKAETMGFNPTKINSKKGKSHSSHADLVINNVMSKTIHLKKAITEFTKLDGKLKEIPGGKLIDLQNELASLSHLISAQTARLSDLI